MGRKQKILLTIFIALDVVFFAIIFSQTSGTALTFGNFALLNPKGIIAQKELNVMVTATVLMLLIAIPVFILTFIIARKYRASNSRADYAPDWDQNSKLQIIWWAAPAIIIFLIAIVNWKSTHELDPYKPIESANEPLTIQVVALQWKWLFIYPEENIATINFIQFPASTPIQFQLTADAPMNSFWIPQLGGQMYAMTGMSTELNLMASEIGEFRGSSAEISGTGFASMKFIAKASSHEDFKAWVASVKNSPKILDFSVYKELAKQDEKTPETFFSSVDEDLFNRIMMQFMAPTETKKMPKIQTSY